MFNVTLFEAGREGRSGLRDFNASADQGGMHLYMRLYQSTLC